jgi:hypothetical protein
MQKVTRATSLHAQFTKNRHGAVDEPGRAVLSAPEHGCRRLLPCGCFAFCSTPHPENGTFLMPRARPGLFGALGRPTSEIFRRSVVRHPKYFGARLRARTSCTCSVHRRWLMVARPPGRYPDTGSSHPLPGAGGPRLRCGRSRRSRDPGRDTWVIGVREAIEAPQRPGGAWRNDGRVTAERRESLAERWKGDCGAQGEFGGTMAGRLRSAGELGGTMAGRLRSAGEFGGTMAGRLRSAGRVCPAGKGDCGAQGESGGTIEERLRSAGRVCPAGKGDCGAQGESGGTIEE